MLDMATLYIINQQRKDLYACIHSHTSKCDKNNKNLLGVSSGYFLYLSKMFYSTTKFMNKLLQTYFTPYWE
jgi:hypothetical protein